MTLWDPAAILTVAGAALVTGGMVQALVLWGVTRIVDRVEKDLGTATDPFYPAVLLAFQKRRLPGRLLAAAQAHHRRQSNRPGAAVPSDLVKREVIAWIKKRIPGWSRWAGLGFWRLAATSALCLSLAGHVTFVITVLANMSTWDPSPDSTNGFLVLVFCAGFQVLIVPLSYLAHNTEKQWDERLTRHCIGIVHAGLGDSFDSFLTAQRLKLPAGFRVAPAEADRSRAALDDVTVPPD
ncbi:hypothetical protein [Actinoplanes cyaneus]|uniref:hypothetical protein n=1 Tax=Actinoplanes cyaneus TaxID=52696 RepID=UPI0019458C4B|nr:hypothetical protein [Actinoplanes cyaneus]MCW2139838.1 hypothetical protein [Actinoplanes cyaneus]